MLAIGKRRENCRVLLLNYIFDSRRTPWIWRQKLTSYALPPFRQIKLRNP
jgi:hypothetical protein